MRFLTLLGFILLSATAIHAEEVDFSTAAISLTNNEMMQSPIYVKKAYLQMYQEDTKAYEKRFAELDTAKKTGKISEREYLQRSEVLKKAYHDVYGTPLAEVSKQITQDPVGMYYKTIVSNKRRPLLNLIHPELHQHGLKVLAGQVLPTQTPDENIQNTPTLQPLGRKNISVNLDAFK